MALWQMPDGVRVEHALQSGSEIPPFYDSMIAKIISHGADRNEARGRLICGLEQTAAFGVTTNQGFLISCLRHPGFASGRGDHGLHRQASRRTAGAARERQGGSRAGGAAALRHQSACAALAQRTQPGGDVSADDADRSRPWRARGRHRARARRRLCRQPRWRRASLRDRRTRPRYDPLPHRRHDGIGKIPARRRPALYPASRRHDCGPRPDARRAGIAPRRPAATARCARR